MDLSGRNLLGFALEDWIAGTAEPGQASEKEDISARPCSSGFVICEIHKGGGRTDGQRSASEIPGTTSETGGVRAAETLQRPQMLE